ncbi:hypothetical protein V6N13_068269 [Hibiscus sabdariffa]
MYLEVEGHLFLIRVQKIEVIFMNKKLGEDLPISGKLDGEDSEVTPLRVVLEEDRHNSCSFDGVDNGTGQYLVASFDTVILESKENCALAIVDHLWEVSRRLDLGGEVKHLVQNFEVSDGQDLLAVGSGGAIDVSILQCKAGVGGLDVASNRYSKAEYVNNKGLTRKLRSMSGIMLGFVSPSEREKAHMKLEKRGHRRKTLEVGKLEERREIAIVFNFVVVSFLACLLDVVMPRTLCVSICDDGRGSGFVNLYWFIVYHCVVSIIWIGVYNGQGDKSVEVFVLYRDKNCVVDLLVKEGVDMESEFVLFDGSIL